MQDSVDAMRLPVASLVQRVRQGDEEAARALVQELFPLVMKIVRSHLPRRTDEEDLAQMVYAKVFSRLEQYAGNVPFEHWVARVAVNTCLNQLRFEKCRPELRWADLGEAEAQVVENLGAVTDAPSPSDRMSARELATMMLETLPPKDRLILRMLDLEDRSVEDVRALTGWGASLIKVRAFRARTRLRKQFAQLWNEQRA